MSTISSGLSHNLYLNVIGLVCSSHSTTPSFTVNPFPVFAILFTSNPLGNNLSSEVPLGTLIGYFWPKDTFDRGAELFNFKVVIWLLSHHNVLRREFLLKSKAVSWLPLQKNCSRAVFLLTSKAVSWLLLQRKSIRTVFSLTSKAVSWLCSQFRYTRAVFLLTSKSLSWLLPQ